MDTVRRVPCFIAIDTGGSYLGIAVHGLVDDGCKALYATTIDVNRAMVDLDHLVEMYGERATRFIAIARVLKGFMAQWEPMFVVCEDTYGNPRMLAAFRSLAECIATIRNTVIEHGDEIPFYLIEAAAVKAAVGVRGNKHNKDDVAAAVLKLGLIDSVAGLDEHATDAIAIGYAQYLRLYRDRGDYERTPARSPVRTGTAKKHRGRKKGA